MLVRSNVPHRLAWPFRAGENMDRTTITYGVQGDTKTTTFNVMFALGEQLTVSHPTALLVVIAAFHGKGPCCLSLSTLPQGSSPLRLATLSSQRFRQQLEAMPRL